jgi:O-antigen/teichoic acid export membrane protein
MKKKVFKSFAIAILSLGLSFSFNLFIAKWLGAEQYGKISFYLSFVQLFILAISINYAALYMGNRIIYDDSRSFCLFFTIHSLLFLTFVLPAFILIDYFIVDHEAVILILLIAYLSIVVETAGLEFNTQKDVVGSILISSLTPEVLLIFCFTILIFLNIESAKGYLYASLLSMFLVFGYVVYKFKPKFYIKKKRFHRAWKFYILGIIGSSFIYLAQVFQKEYGGYAQLASLSISLFILVLLGLTSSIMIKFALPAAHHYWKERNLKDLATLYINNTMIELIISLPLFLFVAVNIDLIASMLGKGYEMLPTIFYILSIGFLMDAFTGITGTLLRATEHEKYELYNQLLRLISGLGLIYFLKDYQYGIVIAITVSMVLFNVVKIFEIYYLFGFVPLTRKHIFHIISFVFPLSLILFGLMQIEDYYWRSVFNLITFGLTSFFIYAYIEKNHYLLEGYQ